MCLNYSNVDLSTKVALIIGPVSGIGEAFGAALLRKQAKVIVHFCICLLYTFFYV